MNNQERQEMKLMEQKYEYGVFAVALNHETEIIQISGADGAGGELRVSFDHVEQLRDMLFYVNAKVEEERRHAEWMKRNEEVENVG